MFDLQFETLGTARVPGLNVELRHFVKTEPRQVVWTSPCDILSLRRKGGSLLLTRGTGGLAEFRPECPVTFRPSNATWETRYDGEAALSVLVKFETRYLDEVEFPVHPCGVLDDTIGELLRIVGDEVRSPGFGSDALIESIGAALAIRLTRYKARTEDLEHRVSKISDAKICLLREYINMQCGRSPSVAELANLFGLSRRSLLRHFKASTGSTVHDFIAQTQLDKAMRLLARSDMIVKEIAFEAGFRTPSNFTHAFRRAVGTTPASFRRARQGPAHTDI